MISTQDKRRCGAVGGVLAMAALLSLAFGAPGAAQSNAADPYMQEAARAAAQRDYRAARIALLNAIERDPRSRPARMAQAKILLKLADGLSAEAELRRAMALGEPASIVRAYLAHAILLQNEPERALAVANEGPVPPDVQGYLARTKGSAFMATGDLGAARRAFDSAAQLAGKDSETWVDIARFRRLNVDGKGAEEAADLAMSLDPRNVDAITMKAELVRDRAGHVPSIAWFRRALAVDPKHVPALIEYAATLGDTGQYRAMLKQVRAALAINRNAVRGFYLQAVLAARAGDYGLARAIMRRTGGKLDDVPGYMLLSAHVELQLGAPSLAADWCEKLLAAQPDNGDARRMLALSMLADEAFEEAFDAIAPLAERADADSWTLLLAARIIEKSGTDDAESLRWRLDLLQRAASLRKGVAQALPPESIAAPDAGGRDARLLIPLMRRALLTGEPGAADAAGRELIAIAPTVPDAYSAAGDAAIGAQNWARAFELFQQSAALRTDENVALRLVHARVMQGNLADASAISEEFLRRNPASEAAQRARIYALFEQGQARKAAPYVDRLVQQSGGRDVRLLQQMGRMMIDAGETSRALFYLRRAYVLMPANPETSSLLGFAIAQRGDNPAAARALLEKAVAIDPESAVFRQRLATASLPPK